ncbi:hypothetical protein BDZ89DRAFT_1102113 [Hymenopellis radicata]|nr:hypothetical protein BDZ89DRAFT_1102113 [Hymenopellis radicata]
METYLIPFTTTTHSLNDVCENCLIIGATGQVGSNVLRELLASSHYSKSGLKDGKWDVVFITLGTNKKSAGSAEAFEKIDRTYVVNSAKEARVEGLTQRVVYCSSIGADPKSSVLYSRSKGLTEQELSGLGYSDAIMYRPAVIAGTNRAEKRMTETVFTSITGVLSHFTSAVEIKVSLLGKSLAMAGFLGTEGLPAEAKAKKAGEAPRTFTLVENAGAVGLANTPWE